jgi:hypothetical protein
MRLPTGLFLGAAAMLGLAAVSGQPEFILPALLLAGSGASVNRIKHQRELRRSLAEIENRLSLTEAELEDASSELGQLRVEREFDRQLLRRPDTAES